MLTSSSGDRPVLMFGRFEVRQRLGSGGMGAVYRAYDPQQQREVALKVLSPEVLAGKPTLAERFRREALHGSRLRHEHLVSLYEFGEAAGTYFLVLELIDGVNLHDYVQEHGPLPPAEARRYLIQMARVLDYLHRQGVVHRDIKPANILLDRKVGVPAAKLTDLGLARATSEDEFRLTREGYTVGTVDYMAPEQARNSALADTRSDIYSLGCTFFYVLTGQPPFPEGTLLERLYQHAEAPAPDVRQLNPAVPADLAAILQRMLAKRPEERFQTPAELLEALLAPPASCATDAVPDAGRMPAMPSAAASPVPAGGANEKAPPAPERTASTTPALVPAADEVVCRQLAYVRRLYDQGLYEQGVQLVLACCRRAPLLPEIYSLLIEGMTQGQQGLPARSWRTWLRGAGAWLGWQLARCRKDWRRLLVWGAVWYAAFPQQWRIWLRMARAAEALQQDELALGFLLHVHQEREEEPAVQQALANYFERRGELEQALVHWKRLAQLRPQDIQAHKKLRDLAALQTMVRSHKAAKKSR
jgi:hypothetical protein